MSASDSDAAMTTAARVGCGRSRRRPGTKRSIRRITAATDDAGDLAVGTGLHGDRGPRSAGAHREALEQRAPRFAAPMPIISRLPRTSCTGAGGERRRRRDGVGQRDERDASRPREQQPAVARRGAGQGESAGSPRQPADQADAVLGQVEDAQLGDRGGGGRAGPRGSRGASGGAEDQARVRRPTASAAGTVSPTRRRRGSPAASSITPSPSTEKPNSSAYPTRMVSASPFM